MSDMISRGIAKNNSDKIATLSDLAGKNIKDYTDLQTALTAIGSQNVTLVISKDVSIVGNITIPKNVTLKFTYPFKLNIANGVTVTINGGIQADNYQIFSTTGTINGTPAVAKIYARWFGVKLDGVTDDTVALNNFFKMFGSGVELIVDGGVALVTGQLNLAGKWNPSSNNGLRKLTFDNASIDYQGQAGKCCMQIYNHQKSVIQGLSIKKSSQDTYVNFVGFWYSKLIDFEIPRLTVNKNTSDITATLLTNDSYTSVFERGVTYHGSEFYGLGETGGGSINSITFDDVKWQGNQITPNAQYNLKFYGTGFQNFTFDKCDLSYSTIADIYIDVTQSSNMRLNFYSCYFDSSIPIMLNYDFKGAIVNTFNCQIANSQMFYMKTKNKTSMKAIGNYGLEADNLLGGGYNLAKNGDFSYSLTNQGWMYSGNNTSGGGVGSPTASILTNANTINGNSLQVSFSQTLQYVGFNGLNAPFDGVYTCAIRLRKTAGNGVIQLNWNGVSVNVDLSPYAVNEEITISSNGASTLFAQGAGLFCTLVCNSLVASPLIIEIMEITMIQGTGIGLNLPLHPTANIVRTIPYVTPVSLADNANIAVTGRSKIRITNSTSVTGITMNAGLFDGQEIWLVHEGSPSSTITFSASSTIADGANNVLTGGTARKFVYNIANNKWYRTS